MNYFDEMIDQLAADIEEAATGYIAFEISIPEKLLQANSGDNGHWAKKAKAIEKARESAYAICRSKMGTAMQGLPWTHATARETYIFPCKAGRDERNATTSTKAYWDGIVDTGLIVDDKYEHLRHLPPEFDIDEKNPRLIIQIWNTSEVMKG